MTEPYSTDVPGWQQALADRETRSSVELCAKCSTRPEDHGMCNRCNKAVWNATDLGRLYARGHADPDFKLTTYAAMSPAGELTTLSWYFLRGTDCNGDPSGWWSPSVRTTDASGHLKCIKSFGQSCHDPFYSSEGLIRELT